MYYAAQDIIEYLMASTGGGMQDSEHAALRAAAHNAYRDVINARDWNWHVAEATLVDDPSIGSGNGVDTFTLPENVKNLDALIPPQTSSTPVMYLSPTDWLRVDVRFPQLNSPVYWTVMRDPSAADRWLLKLAGTPQSVTYKYTFRRRPPTLRYMGFEPICLTITGSPAPPTGSVVRYSGNTNFPTSAFGRNPYVGEKLMGISGSNRGTVDTGKALWSDYLDVSDSMYTAVLSGAEAWLSRLLGKNVEGAMAVHSRDMRLAFEADGVAPISGSRGESRFASVARALGYYSPPGLDTGV